MAPKSIFRFERSKLTTKTTKTTKEVTLDGTQFNKHNTAAAIQNALHNNISVSASGRTLQALLSLSYPDQLSSYSVKEVKFVWGRSTVKYSRPDSSYADLLQEVRDLKTEVRNLKTEVRNLKTEVRDLKTAHDDQEGIMTSWQTAHLVFHALGVFAWEELSADAQARLAAHGILDFPTLFYKQSGANDAVATAARSAYQSLNQSIRRLAPTIIRFKQVVSEERRKLPHPTISQEYLDQFLDDLGANSLPLSNLELQLFHYLRTTSNTPANIHSAK